MRLFVSNIPYQTDEEELRALFVASGFFPGEVKIILDRDTGQSRGFAFLELEECGSQAIKALHGAKLNGRALVVREAEPRQERERRR